MPAIWYVDATGANSGPIDLDQARNLIGSGAIAAATLVWIQGMADWGPAGETAALRAFFPAAPPPPRARAAPPAQSTAAAAPTALVGGAGLIPELHVWGFFWRAIVSALGNALIIPAPWSGPLIWRYLGATTRLPDGRPFGFDGRPGDIWWVFVLQGVLLWAGQMIPRAQIVVLPASLALTYFVVKWFCEKLRPPEGVAPLKFVGGFWTNLGWWLFYLVSFISIIGWAWVLAAYYRWLARNVDGGLAFEFRGSGLSILWRMLTTILASCLVIPIPWVIAWLARWTIAQFHVAVRGG